MVDGTGHTPSLDPTAADVEADLEDEALAAAARALYRTSGIVSIEPDPHMRAALGSDEQLLAIRQVASVEDLLERDGPRRSGRLAITTRRLMMVDGQPVTLAGLEELDDVSVVMDRLLVTLTTGAGFRIDAEQPRLLRVQLAAARARRSEDQTGSSSSS
jgi:hypothetical protein